MSHRRFLNLVLRCNGGFYTVNHLDTSNLFYASAAVARKMNLSMEEKILELERLPVPSFSFQPCRFNNYNIIKGVDLFGPFGESKLICADGIGQTAIYDTISHSVQIMPKMNAPKGPMHIVLPLPHTRAHATSAAACDSNSNTMTEFLFFQQFSANLSESVYIMDMAPRCPFSFEVLSCSSKGWVWRPLPPPPFLRDPVYEPRWDSGAVVNGSTLFVSPSTAQEKGIGTYCFDTVAQEWKKAGDWVLPFLGKAEYVPELGHWFGLSHCSPYHFCTISSLDPPEVKHVWSDLDLPEGWSLTNLYLVNLGLGRFCTAKFFDARDPSNNDGTVNTVAVFTGVEVVLCDDKAGGFGFEVLKHMSKCVTNLDIMCVL